MPIQSVRTQTRRFYDQPGLPPATRLNLIETHSQLERAAALKLPIKVGAFPIFLSGVNNPVVILRTICGMDRFDLVDSPVFCLAWEWDLGPGTDPIPSWSAEFSSSVTRRLGCLLIGSALGPGGTSWMLGVVPGESVRWAKYQSTVVPTN